MRIFMDDLLLVARKLNIVLPKLCKKLGLDYKVIRISGGFKIFTMDNEPIVYADLINKRFELLGDFNLLPRHLRRMLIEDLRFITLFNVKESEIEKRFV